LTQAYSVCRAQARAYIPTLMERYKATDALPDFINQRAHDAWSRATFGLTLTIKHLVTLGNWLAKSHW